MADGSILDWPSEALAARAHGLDLSVTSVSGGASVTGVERLRMPDAGLWTFRMDIRIGTQTQIRLVRALAGLSQGRSRVWRVCVGDCGRGPGAMPDWRLPPHIVPHSDDATFSDGTGYRGETAPARLLVAAAARATSITMTMETAVAAPEPGQLFTLDDGLLLITGVTDLGGGSYGLEFTPPLRRAVAAPSRIIFDRPTGLFRLARDNGLSLTLEGQRFGTLGLEFTEHVLR